MLLLQLSPRLDNFIHALDLPLPPVGLHLLNLQELLPQVLRRAKKAPKKKN